MFRHPLGVQPVLQETPQLLLDESPVFITLCYSCSMKKERHSLFYAAFRSEVNLEIYNCV